MDQKIDAIDRNILEELQKDCRQTLKELGAKVGLSPTPIHERIKRLEKNKVILSYSAIVDSKKMGQQLSILLSVILKEHTQEKMRVFETAAKSWPEVKEVFHIAGNSDYLLKIQVKDMDDYYAFIHNRVSLLENVISQMHSSFVLNEVKSDSNKK
jgi:Lrp/AsnC family transcriptional regulator, leucine-responsive regulatory protein